MKKKAELRLPFVHPPLWDASPAGWNKPLDRNEAEMHRMVEWPGGRAQSFVKEVLKEE